jgi:hypothetical protein
MKYVAIAALLLLGGCLEATDLMGGGIRAKTQYCQVPDGVALCKQTPR